MSDRPRHRARDRTGRIKANAALRGIQIIVVTSYALSGDDVKGVRGRRRRVQPTALLAKVKEFLGEIPSVA